MFRNQKTLNHKIVLTGKGLHTGRLVRMEISPAAANTGIVFQRAANPNAPPLVALAQNVTSTELCTTLGSGISSVATIEHLMAAFVGVGIDNAIVRVNAPELPIMDGSSKPFVDELVRCGSKEQQVGKRYYVVKKSFEFRLGDRLIKIDPARSIRYRCSIDFGKGFIGQQSLEFSMTKKSFLKLSGSRTFCHVQEVNAMRAVGLALGGSLENAVVVTDTGVMNEEGLRSQDEFVRHKLLDCIGDLALLGAPLVGCITVHKPGHTLHAAFLNELLMKKDRYLALVEPDAFRVGEAAELGIAAPIAVYG